MAHIGYVESISTGLLKKLNALFPDVISLNTVFIVARRDISPLAIVVLPSLCEANGINGGDLNATNMGVKANKRKAEKRRRILRERLKRKR